MGLDADARRGTSPSWRGGPSAGAAAGRPGTAIVIAGGVLALGAALRLHGFAQLVLIDDEWHAVHRVLYWSPARMLVDFNIADYGIPIGLAYWLATHTIGLSELVMRAPMMACGLAFVALAPLAVARPLGLRVAALLGVLVAMSPVLVIYSETARPYMITLLLSLVVHHAFQSFWNGSNRAAPVVALGAAAAAWLHLVAAVFVVAPFAWALADLRRMRREERRRAALRLVVLGVVTLALMLALLLPPLVARAGALTEKLGARWPTIDTWSGALHWWFGTTHGAVVAAALALAAAGTGTAWRAYPVFRTACVGLALTLVALLVLQPMFLENVPTLGRYLLPALPVLLLALAAGTVRIADAVARRAPPSAGAWTNALLLLPVAALAATSPLPDLLRAPSSHRLALDNYFDFRPRHDASPTHVEQIPLSPFWSQLARKPPGTLRIAAAPFFFESYHWDAGRWERLSGQRVIPGFLVGLCTRERFGEVPAVPQFRFANAVHLADPAALAARRIDYVVWQKPYRHPSQDAPNASFEGLEGCEPALRARFPVAYEDAVLVAFRVPATR